jgi:hypothetical protein
MTEKQVNCFKCGGDGHIARNCPQCILPSKQPTMPATTVENQDTSQEIALRPNKKPIGLPDNKITTTNVQIPNASIVEGMVIWPETVAKVKISSM